MSQEREVAGAAGAMARSARTSPYTAKETRDFASQLNLAPCFTPVASPESNGMA
jgi:transposase InsO family protein